MLKRGTKADLEALHVGNIKEGISLEYKASPAIDKKDDNKKVEMARDVSAFANADGGQIIYGMMEQDHEPAGLDNGIDEKAYPEIWFEQVLQQHITPPIPGLRIRHIPLSKPMVAVVIRASYQGRPAPGFGRPLLPTPQLQPPGNGALRSPRLYETPR
jgi:predicted HTH transcriptional regulator